MYMIGYHIVLLSIVYHYINIKYNCMLIIIIHSDIIQLDMEDGVVSWRKSIRCLFNIHRTTHCVLLNEMCDDIPIHDQLHSRLINFY